VSPLATQWTIRESLESEKAVLASASAGALCPCHASTAVSERFGLQSWLYKQGPGAEGGWRCVKEACADQVEVKCERSQPAAAAARAANVHTEATYLF